MNATDDLAPPVAEILSSVRERHVSQRPAISVMPRSFDTAISDRRDMGDYPVIAEIKPTSPTTPTTRTDDPVELARDMVAGGASALSVLTEPDHFGGSPAALSAVREAVDVPVLRKDFILDESQLDEVEADLILLIVRFVDDLSGLLRAAEQRGFQVLVEVHTEDELTIAIEAGASIIGINNRDLTSLSVDLETFEQLAPMVPDDVILIAESGMKTPEDVQRMAAAGADAFLIGSAIMAGDVRERTETFVEAST